MAKESNNTIWWCPVQLLTLMFIYLKLTHHINWSWWWVLLPVYGGTVALLAVIALCALFLGGTMILASYAKDQKAKKEDPYKHLKNLKKFSEEARKEDKVTWTTRKK